MDSAMSRAKTICAVEVSGGVLAVGVWEAPRPAPGVDADTCLLIHGVTSSHMAWEFFAEQAPGLRLVAPDLRGRGRSNAVAGSAGMAAHAADMAAVVEALGRGPVRVVGHSMGAFVAVVFAHRYPHLVRDITLVDGGLPLAVPEGIEADDLVAAILGPTAERLTMTFQDVEHYRDFWRQHPAFADEWNDTLDRYFAYDVEAADEGVRAATTYATTREDTIDLNGGSPTLADALAHLDVPTRWITVPRGLKNETPGLYSQPHVEELLRQYPTVGHEHWQNFNHYTVVMSEAGAQRLVSRLVDPSDASRAQDTGS